MHANGNVWAAGKGVNEYVGENNHHSINYSPSAHLHWLYGLGVSGNWLRLEISIELEPQPKFVLASQSLGYGDGEWRRENLINIHTNWWSLSLNWINFPLEISISFNTHYYHCWCEALRHVTSRCDVGLFDRLPQPRNRTGRRHTISKYNIRLFAYQWFPHPAVWLGLTTH